MANNIRGITVEIGGDTKKLNEALSSTGKETKNIEAELKKVEKLLKLDPTNTELLAQKQELLAQAVGQARDRVSALHQAQEQMSRAFAANAGWEAAYTPLREEIDKTTKELGTLARQEAQARAQLEAGEIDADAYAKVKDAFTAVEKESKRLEAAKRDLDAQFQDGHIDAKEYRQFQRDTVEAERKLKSLETAAKKSDIALSKLSSAAKEAGDKLSKAADAVEPFSKAAAGVVLGAVTAVKSSEELRTDLSKLDNNARQAGVGVDAVRQAFEAFNVATDETDSSIEATSNLLRAGFTENNLQAAMEGITGAYLAFPDTMKVESLADSLQETLATGEATGQFGELLDRLGIGAENFSKALEGCVTEAQKQDQVLTVLAGAGMMDYYETWKETNPELIRAKDANWEMKEAMAALGEVLQPLVTDVLQVLSQIIGDIASAFGGLDRDTQTFIATAVLLTAGLAPAMKGLSGVCDVVSKATDFFDKLGVKGRIVVIALTAIAFLVGMVISAWGDMSPLQKAASVLGIVAAAALTAAVAVGAFSSAATLGLAAVGIVAAVALVAAAVTSATNDAKSAAASIPAYATGTDYHPGGLALVGEEGAEVLSLPRGARVYNNRETAAMLHPTQEGGGGGGLETQELIDVMNDGFARLISAVERKKTDVYLDKTRLTREINREQKWIAKTEGASLVRA